MVSTTVRRAAKIVAGVSHDVPASPDSWEVADVDDSLRRLMLSATAKQDGEEVASLAMPSTEGEEHAVAQKAKEDSIAQVDQFPLEAQQNLREWLTVLRMEQDVLNFIRNPTQQQMEFQQLPTSYQRLAAPRTLGVFQMNGAAMNHLPASKMLFSPIEVPVHPMI